jgi:hypothetical protein
MRRNWLGRPSIAAERRPEFEVRVRLRMEVQARPPLAGGDEIDLIIRLNG